MPQAIARMYSSKETASAAVTDLQDHGFSADAIDLFERSEAQPATATDAPAPVEPVSQTDPVGESILKAGVHPSHAQVYAERVHQGQVLVVVLPPFGYARTAEEILQSHSPTAVDLPQAEAEPRAAATGWNNATPLSSALGLRVLLSDPAPLSNWLKRPTLTPEAASSRTLQKIRQQSRDAAPLSSKLGMPTLSDNAAPLSSKLNWRVIGKKAAPLSERFRWRVLSDDPAPLSSKFGWRVLSHDPAPLSSKFGWRVLLNDPAPLSSALGWSVLSKDQ